MASNENPKKLCLSQGAGYAHDPQRTSHPNKSTSTEQEELAVSRGEPIRGPHAQPRYLVESELAYSTYPRPLITKIVSSFIPLMETLSEATILESL